MSNADPPTASPSPNASLRPTSKDAFPAFYFREKKEPLVGNLEDGDRSIFSGGATASFQAPSAVRERTLAVTDEGVVERVAYAPMPEKKRLGYISVASLIINKMIGQ